MLRLVKVIRLLWALISRTPYVNWKASMRSGADELQYRAHRIQVGCTLLCDILGIDVHTEGAVPSQSGMLVVSNHFGVLDPLILASVIPSAPVGHAGMTHWPLVGWVSLAHGMVPVERERRSAVARFAHLVRERLEAGVHVVVFPEGTTSGELEVRPFKTGAFEAIAGLHDRWVLPVYLAVDSIGGGPATGAARRRVVWAGGEQSFQAHALALVALDHMSFTVRIGAPIPVRGRDRKELAQVAREAVEHLRTHGETIHTAKSVTMDAGARTRLRPRSHSQKMDE
jgi:1-acyl-sn-glycerol-3-phosphate acyltransferase